MLEHALVLLLAGRAIVVVGVLSIGVEKAEVVYVPHCRLQFPSTY
jgi:hypothetical protein